MRNRETVLRVSDIISGKLKNLRFMVQRQQPIENFTKELDSAEELLEQLRSYVEMEERSTGEINRQQF